MRHVSLGAAALAAALAVPGSATAQSLAQRVDRVADGTVRLSFAARPGVCGNGRSISTGQGGRHDEWQSDCEAGPVRLVIERQRGRTTDLRAYVGGRWRGTADADLGQVPAREAGEWLLALAEGGGPASEDAVFPATLADSMEAWPGLLRIARNGQLARKTRKSAVFWLGQAAADAATRGLDSLAEDDREDREVREAAIFALSQRPREEGVPVLIRIAKSSRDPRLRRTALFWLGQSDDPAAIRLFEELLSGS